MLSAIALARRVEAGEATPSGLVEQCAEAIAAREADIHAFTTLDLDHARAAAAQPGMNEKPLRGLPVGIKDIFDTADMPTEYGSPIYADYRPRVDAALVAAMRGAGGIAIGKTVTTEFAHQDPGQTRNPHNLEHTPGGSSSGSAAAVAVGFVPLAFGSQTGGSVIRPASFCGVAGFKPSYRLLPTVGMKCVSWHLDTAGLFAASVADLAFAAAALSGRELRVDQRTPASPRVGVLREHPWPAASGDMMAALDTTARATSAAMGRVKEVRLPPVLAAAFRAHRTIHAYEALSALASERERHGERLGPSLRDLLDGATSISPDVYDDARRVARQARQAMADMMSDIDVVLSPSAPGAAPAGLKSTGTSTFNRLWTLMGTPCVNVPGLHDHNGLPLGMQVIGRFGADRETLEAAQFIEAALGRQA
jgi:Asp-tRNA(Asn)/Glu-tRNA(Gln) amidotransferase A subunit family amidase